MCGHQHWFGVNSSRPQVRDPGIRKSVSQGLTDTVAYPVSVSGKGERLVQVSWPEPWHSAHMASAVLTVYKNLAREGHSTPGQSQGLPKSHLACLRDGMS